MLHLPSTQKRTQRLHRTPPAERHTCSMCGKMCAVRTTNMILEGKDVSFVDKLEDC